LKRDRALFNRLGFNNHGALACANRIAAVRARNRVRIPVGINIGKTKIVDNDKAADDYAESFRAVADVADYVVVNVSSPNTPGLRDLQKTDELARILAVLADLNARRTQPRPLLVKIAPDLAVDDAHRCAEVALQSGCAGLVVSNTTISREGLHELPPDGPGGISGAPLLHRSTDLLRTLAASHAKLAFIGVGGVEDGASAQAKLDAGASLVQSYTGFVYSGPTFARLVCRALVERRRALPAYN
jgi:dihydroorotate dehydrogenase